MPGDEPGIFNSMNIEYIVPCFEGAVMQHLSIEALGSSGDLYEIEIQFGKSRPTISCNCDAGQRGVQCKHRIALLRGDYSNVPDPQDQADVRSALTTMSNSPLMKAFEAYEQAESAKQNAEKALKVAKDILARTMNQGF